MPSQTNIRIRLARKEDVRGIAQVHVTSWQTVFRGQVPDAYLDLLSVEQREEMWDWLLAESRLGAFTFVAEEGGNIVGFISVGPSPDDAAKPGAGELHAIYVSPGVMGRGVGSALMEEGFAALRTQGQTEVFLWVLTSNEQARRFYERFGGYTTGETRTDIFADQPFPVTRYCIPLTRATLE